jgi:4-hydroxy-3-polyprenylbenzoate decarboxylase
VVDLREYMDELRKRNELVEVDEPISLDLELPAIARKLMYRGGPAVIFRRIKENSLPAVVNLFGTWERVQVAMGNASINSLEKNISLMLKPRFASLSNAIKSLSEAAEMGKFLPRVTNKSPVHEVEWKRIDLRRIPAIRQWIGEPAFFYTMGITFIERDGVVNFGYYRIQVLSEDKIIMHWMPNRRSAEYSRHTNEVAIVFGPDPLLMLMAATPIPHPLDKVLVTGMLSGRGIELSEGRTISTHYPARAEVVIEAELTGEYAEEGPFGDHVGVYSIRKPYPVAKVKAIYSRSDAVVPVTVTGKPVLEDGNMILFANQVIIPMLKLMMPELIDIYMPPSGLGYVYIVSIRKTTPGQARKVMTMLWSLSPLYGKLIIVVDDDVDVRNMNQVMYAISAHMNPARDLLIISDYPTEELDPSTPIPNLGSKVGIDATRKLPEEYGGQKYPEDAASNPVIEENAEKMVNELLRRWRQ